MYYKIAKKCGGKERELSLYFMPMIIKFLFFLLIIPFFLFYKLIRKLF